MCAGELGFGVVRLDGNGLSLTDPSLAKALAGAGRTEVCISPRSADAHGSDCATGRPGGSSLKTEAIRSTLAAGIFTFVILVVTSQSVGAQESVARVAHDGFDEPRPRVVHWFAAPDPRAWCVLTKT